MGLVELAFILRLVALSVEGGIDGIGVGRLHSVIGTEMYKHSVVGTEVLVDPRGE